MKKGFTLAEVLITITIIGVVAATVVTNNITKTDKKTLYAEFLKSTNTIKEAFGLSIAENGSPQYWSITDSNSALSDYLAPHLKITRFCQVAADCFASSYKDLAENAYEMPFNTSSAAKLNDGTSILLRNMNGGAFLILFDTNGEKKPNILGRDLFVENFSNERFTPSVLYDETNCNPGIPPNNGAISGIACFSRLIKEGKMNY